MPLRVVAALLLVFVRFGSPRELAAQETVNHASLSGRVVDATGAPIAGARVTVRQTETNATTTADTTTDGRFKFPVLRVGRYEISVSQPGFAPITKTLTLTVGAAFDLPITLAVGPIETSVTVAADATVVETARSQIAGTISQAEVRAIPMSGRNFLDLALLVPGVSPTNVGGGSQTFPETSAVPGVGISVGSQRNFSNNFMVDGLSANDDAAGLAGMPYGIDAIDQFQVVTSGGQAELGRALGGYVSVVTRSGSNALKGDLYGYFRDDSLNAKNHLSGTTLPMHQSQYGFGIGGPIAQNRTFFFGNVEQRRLDQTGLTTILDANVAIINARLAQTGYLGPAVVTGEFPNPADSTYALGKIDHEIGDRGHLSIRYSLYDVASRNSRGAGALSAPSASAGLDNRDQTIAAGHVQVLSARTVLETRAQFAHSDLAAPPTDLIGPSVTISGVATFGTLSTSPTGRRNNMIQVVSNLSHQAGAHSLRTGVDFLYNDLTITFPRAARGTYSFSTLSSFLNGTYNTAGFTQTFGETMVALDGPNFGIYVQDEWRAGIRLTINAGLRYDLQWLDTIDTDTNNVSPRLGIVWTPSGDGRTIVRANAGLFFDRVPLRPLANALLSAGNTTDLALLRQVNVSLSPAQAGAPVFPATLAAAAPSVTLPNLTTMQRDLENAYSRQASVELERQIGHRTTVSVGYQHLRGRKLIAAINQNVPSCVATGTNNGCRPIAQYGNNSQYSSVGRSSYDGLHVSLMQRPGAWGQYRVAYTYSLAENNVGEAFFNGPIDPFDIEKDWGRSDDDQRHRFAFTGTLMGPSTPVETFIDAFSHSFQVSVVIQAYSGLPFNITSGVNTIQGTAGRPIVDGAFIDRNAGDGSAFNTTSLRVSRAFAIGSRTRLDGLVEVFNLFNQRNDIARNGNFGSGAYPTNPLPTFGTVTAVGESRSMQIGIRLRF